MRIALARIAMWRALLERLGPRFSSKLAWPIDMTSVELQALPETPRIDPEVLKMLKEENMSPGKTADDKQYRSVRALCAFSAAGKPECVCAIVKDHKYSKMEVHQVNRLYFHVTFIAERQSRRVDPPHAW